MKEKENVTVATAAKAKKQRAAREGGGALQPANVSK